MTAAVGVVLAGWFRAPALVTARTILPRPTPITLTRVGAGAAALLDKTPLFLPTEWNTSQKDVKLPESGGALAPYPWKQHFDQRELKLGLPSPVTVPANAAEALAIPPPGTLFNGLGRSDATTEPLPSRGAFLEVVAAGSGQRVLSEALAAARPPNGSAWQALDFLAVIDATGLVSLDLTARSGVDEVDRYFSQYLSQTLRIGTRLPPGFYRICVGP